MAFSQSQILGVRAAHVGGDLAVSWESSAPAGSTYQVYLDRTLVWSGRSRRCLLPHPRERARVEVGVVDAGEARSDLSASLPTPPGGGVRLRLAWLGGTYLGVDLAGFRVYLGPAPGAAVSYARPAGSVAAYTPGVTTDGYGMGGYGMGGYGLAAASYSWTSGPLAGGTWNYAVKPFDAAGNEGPAVTGSASVAGPPTPPSHVAYAFHVDPTVGYGRRPYGSGGYGVEPTPAPYVTVTWTP